MKAAIYTTYYTLQIQMWYTTVNFPLNYKISSINYFENVNLCGVKTDSFQICALQKKNTQFSKENYNIPVPGLNFPDHIKQFIKGFHKCHFYFFPN